MALENLKVLNKHSPPPPYTYTRTNDRILLGQESLLLIDKFCVGILLLL